MEFNCIVIGTYSGVSCSEYPEPPNDGKKQCQAGCAKAASICKKYISPLSIVPAVLLEMSCVATTIGAPTCMGSVNTAQGLAVAKVLAQCDTAENICKTEKCDSQCTGKLGE